MNIRIKKVREELEKLDLDAIFVTDQHNVSYLTEFVGLSPNEREGFFFITRKNAYLLTFSTYFGLYKNGGVGFDVLNITLNLRLHEHLSEIIGKENIKTIGIEKDNLTLAEFESLKNKLKVQFLETSQVVEKGRIIKSEEEVTHIRNAAKVGDMTFELIKRRLKKGVSERDIALEIEYFIKKNADDVAFPPIVAFNANAAIPHYMPDNRQQLTDGSLILLDFGAKVNGYCSDMTRVIFFGKPRDEWIKAYNGVLEAQKLVLSKLQSGKSCGKFADMANKYLSNIGYPDIPHGLGHGVGIAIHEAPRLKAGSREMLAEGMVVTVEPGIYIIDKYGIRIEDLVVLKGEGIDILSHSPKNLTIID